MAKNTYGTGAFMLMNVGASPQASENRLLATVGWTLGSGAPAFMLEGSVFVAGAVVQWLRDGLSLFARSDDVEALARQVPDAGGVLLVPAFVGLGAPHWDADARGTIVGLTRGTTKAHVARAALESIAFQSYDVLEAMQRDAARPLTELRVDGGAARNDLLMQFQADVMGVPVVRPVITETTALGAAYLAGLATGVLDRNGRDCGALEGRAPLRAVHEQRPARRQGRGMASGGRTIAPVGRMTGPGVIQREQLVGQLRDARPWDVLVIGGGATGLGIAVDAAARGYRTALDRGQGLFQRHVEPQHEARAWRRALSRAGQREARPRSPG